MQNRNTQPDAFPALTLDQMAAMQERATCRVFNDGDVLFEQGQRDIGFYVVQSGHVLVVQRTKEGDRPFAEHFDGEFTGEMGMLARSAAVGAAIAQGEVKVMQFDHEGLRSVVAEIPELSEIILGAFIRRRALLEEAGFEAMRLIGSRWSKETAELRDFLARNRVLFRWIDPDQCELTESCLFSLDIKPSDLPVVVSCPGGVMRKPTIRQVASVLGLQTNVDQQVYDLVVVGAGPAGLATAVYGASEGLATLVLEARAPGGQAGTSSRIENYLGFPMGLSGGELADRALTQAQKFGAQFVTPCEVEQLECEGEYKTLRLADGGQALGRCVVVASGARYRRLPVTDLERYEGSAVMYAATATEARVCEGCDIVVVGGGNSAGQAAVYLAGFARQVRMLIRGKSLDSTMSRYLIDRIEKTTNIELMTETEIVGCDNDGPMQSLRIVDRKAGAEREIPATAVFVMIGADPCTAWLGDCVGLDRRGFVVTGQDAVAHQDYTAEWPHARQPYYLETTQPGVFAVGDVRASSIKRVASAVGEGSMTVAFVHEVLKAG